MTPPPPPAPDPPAPTPLVRLLGYLRPHRAKLAVGGGCVLLGGAAGLASPLAAKSLLDTLEAGGAVAAPLVLLAALFLLGVALQAGGAYLLERNGEDVVLGVRTRLVRRITHLRAGAVDRVRPGDLISRVTTDTTVLREAAAESMVNAVNGVFLLIGALALMAVVDAVLLGVTVAVVLVVVAVEAVVLPRVARASERAQTAVGEIGAGLERLFGAFHTVKASGAEDRVCAEIGDAAVDARGAGVSMALWRSVGQASAGLSVQLAFLVVLGIGGLRVQSGELPVSSLVAFLLYLYYLNRPIDWLSNGFTQIQVALGAVRRLAEVERLPVEDIRTARTGTPHRTDRERGGPARVRFHDVRFAYEPGRANVHDGLTFTVEPGGVTALVGASGVGKTTVFALLERFYEPDSGVVELDGRDVRDWPVDELRRTIGYVEQDAPVLAGTLRDNLRFAYPDADDGALNAALRTTRLDDLLRRLPDGLDSAIGHRGATLSGGERQRIAIARALVRSPRLLLMDEASSQLDAVNEKALREVVAEASRQTTVVLIAHRLSTVAGADRILLLESGRVRATGTHTHLVEHDAHYRLLARTQFADAPAVGAVAPGRGGPA